MKDRIGLILSHIFVREGEHHKWKWIEHSVDKHRELYDNFYIVLSGHGVLPPQHIQDKVDVCYWEKQIREQDVGQGHPHFCIMGYQACVAAGCGYTLKNRAFDWLEHDEVINCELVFCSNNTDFSRDWLGDLLIFGNTNEMLDLWSCLPWDYDLVDGLENLYKNMKHKWSEDWLQSNANFLSSQQMGWMTMNDFKGRGPKYWGM
tara:strand:+ start:214 stop:825 length:612 start_codon:yes stop_codon:yes gene_type:complete